MLRGAEVICRRKNAAATPLHPSPLPFRLLLYFFSAHFMTTRSRQWSPSRSRRRCREERDFASFASLLCFFFFAYFLCFVSLLLFLQFPLDLCIFIAKYIMRIIVVADDFYDYSCPLTKGGITLMQCSPKKP